MDRCTVARVRCDNVLFDSTEVQRYVRGYLGHIYPPTRLHSKVKAKDDVVVVVMEREVFWRHYAHLRTGNKGMFLRQ